MECKEITVNNKKFLAILLPNATLLKEQHTAFAGMFKESVAEFENITQGLPAFEDPTKDLTPEVLDDTNNNAILLPDDIMQVLNKDPESNVDNEVVYLVKPSGVYIMTYLEASSVNFPRIVDSSTKAKLDPQEFISAYAH